MHIVLLLFLFVLIMYSEQLFKVVTEASFESHTIFTDLIYHSPTDGCIPNALCLPTAIKSHTHKGLHTLTFIG